MKINRHEIFILEFLFLLTLFSNFGYANSIIIGKVDRVDLPLLKLENLKAKIDTGAHTSSLHCSYIKAVNHKTVEFKVLDDSHKKFNNKIIRLPLKRIAKVKSSNGILEKRYVIETTVKLFNKNYKTEFTLRNRKKMDYPILLGRKLLKRGFIVDVTQDDLSFKQKSIK